MSDSHATSSPHIDWEAFYRRYREPNYVAGFEILNKLGGGAFGIVFKARKTSIAKDYAIKFLKVDDETVRDAVLGELQSARLFAQIDHPNLVSIEDQGTVDGIPYILMGYAGEETLATRLKQGRLERADALRLFVQIARGVQALHERMLVHFDLKPANIYLKDDVARVGDYGLSKLVTASRRSLSFGRGTTYYMAPEILDRQGDHRSDIYSLGIMLYEMLLGEVPFRGETEWEVLKQHERVEPTYPDDLAAGDRALLQACLAKDPDQRVQSIGDLLAALDGEGALPTPTRTGSALDRTRVQQAAKRPAHAARRIGGWVVAMAVLFLLVLAAGAMLFALAPQPGPQAMSDDDPPTRVRASTFGPPTQPVEETAPPAPSATEFEVAIDEAIASLQRLRAAGGKIPDAGDTAKTAIAETLRKVQGALPVEDGAADSDGGAPDAIALVAREIFKGMIQAAIKGEDQPLTPEEVAYRRLFGKVLGDDSEPPPPTPKQPR